MNKVKLFDLFTQSKPLHYKKGERVHRPDETHQGVYYIEEGYIKAYVLTKDGREHLHGIYKQGEMFPLRWALLDIPGSTFYEAFTPAVLRRIPKDEFLKEITAHPTLALELNKKIIAVFDIYVAQLNGLQHAQAQKRVIAILLLLAKRFGTEEEGKILFNLPLSHQDLANSINMTRETVSRELALLENKGIIVSKNLHNRIVINDRERLQEELAA
jgi:CRP-like cAMP-binding protein